MAAEEQLTEAQAKFLFANYNNISDVFAKQFVEKVFQATKGKEVATYAEFAAMTEFDPGVVYILPFYKTSNIVPNTAIVNTAATTETLYLKVVDQAAKRFQGYTANGEFVEYQITNGYGSLQGLINRRANFKYNVDCPFDFRYAKFIRYKDPVTLKFDVIFDNGQPSQLMTAFDLSLIDKGNGFFIESIPDREASLDPVKFYNNIVQETGTTFAGNKYYNTINASVTGENIRSLNNNTINLPDAANSSISGFTDVVFKKKFRNCMFNCTAANTNIFAEDTISSTLIADTFDTNNFQGVFKGNTINAGTFSTVTTDVLKDFSNNTIVAKNFTTINLQEFTNNQMNAKDFTNVIATDIVYNNTFNVESFTGTCAELYSNNFFGNITLNCAGYIDNSTFYQSATIAMDNTSFIAGSIFQAISLNGDLVQRAISISNCTITELSLTDTNGRTYQRISSPFQISLALPANDYTDINILVKDAGVNYYGTNVLGVCNLAAFS